MEFVATTYGFIAHTLITFTVGALIGKPMFEWLRGYIDAMHPTHRGRLHWRVREHQLSDARLKHILQHLWPCHLGLSLRPQDRLPLETT